jgi:hypothetical protein
MAVRLSSLRTGRALLARNIIYCFWYSFLLKAVQTTGLSAAGILEPATFRLVAQCLNHYDTVCNTKIGKINKFRAVRFLARRADVQVLKMFTASAKPEESLSRSQKATS